MGRLRQIAISVAVSVFFCLLAACGGGSNGTNVVTNPVPAILTLAPFANSSLELGKTMLFTAIPERADSTPITTPVQFFSSNDAVVSVASNGAACAGTWDSLTNPQVCTPGQVGVAHITAQAEGVTSSTATVFVHQHVDNVTISPALSQPALVANCVSKGQQYILQARAFSQGTDITASVGPFAWNGANLSMVNIRTLIPGLTQSQAQVTGNTPGFTTIFASVGAANSVATPFIICPVKSISITANGNSNTDFTVPVGTTITAGTTITDAAGNVITGIPLTWTSSNVSSVSVAGTNDTAIITTPLAGGATIIASCTPPTCNPGFQPSMPVYPQKVIRVTSGSSGGVPSLTLLVTSDGCANASGCVSTMIPLTTSSNITGTPVTLPSTPNSLVFPVSASLGSGYLGTDFSQQGTKGLMAIGSGTGFSLFVSAPGKVLAVSPDANSVIVSDTADSPNQLYFFKTASNTSTPFSISGATAAAFSPDSLKAFVLAGSTLYIFSTQDALQTVPLAAAASDVSFLPRGGSAAILGGTPSGITLWDTIDGTQIGGAISTPVRPTFIHALPDGHTVLAVDSPGIDLINTSTAAVSSFSFGQGNFTPKQLLVSSDGTKAYVVSNLPIILAFDLNTRTSSGIALSGNAAPLAAALTPDGGSLYVGASDDQVHILNTDVGIDTQQVAFQPGFCRDSKGNPLTTNILISAASQAGLNTTYSYSLSSGPPLITGESVAITNMTNTGNNGVFTITATGANTFTVTNPAGVTASGQNGTGALNSCPPDILGFKP